MTEFDKQYLMLLKKILAEGVEVENRTGVNTIKIPEHSFEFDLSKEFPILTTKQTFFKNAIIEMLWIWQMQSNNVKDLQDRGVHIWDKWMVDADGIYRIYEPDKKCEYDPDKEVVVLDPLSVPIDDPSGKLSPKTLENGNIMKAKSLIEGKTIKEAKYYGKEYAYTIGKAYGFIVNRYKHTQNLIKTIMENPTDRRLVKSLWQDEFIREAVLPSCVWSTEWDVTDGKLNLLVHQRSCDTPVGLPFNVTQYGTLLKMIASVTDLRPGTVYYSIKDAHVYVDQIEGIREQLRREERYECLSKLSINNLINLQSSLTKQKKILQSIIDRSDKNSKDPYLTGILKEYKLVDTDLLIIDMIINPTKTELWVDPEIDDFFKFDNSRELKNIKVKKYKHMGRIDFPVTQ